MSELAKKEQKNKLAEILFDLDKIDLNMNVAKDCMAQLEKKWINDQLKILRESLKELASNKNKSYSIIQKITELQTQKKKIHHLNVTLHL